MEGVGVRWGLGPLQASPNRPTRAGGLHTAGAKQNPVGQLSGTRLTTHHAIQAGERWPAIRRESVRIPLEILLSHKVWSAPGVKSTRTFCCYSNRPVQSRAVESPVATLVLTLAADTGRPEVVRMLPCAWGTHDRERAK